MKRTKRIHKPVPFVRSSSKDGFQSIFLPIAVSIIFIASFSLIILPSVITSLYGNWGMGAPEHEAEPRTIKNPLTDKSAAEDFENYIVGVLAAEVPVSFEEEALKAQAVAARTYALRQFVYSEAESLRADEIGQAYLPDEEFTAYRGKLEAAVKTTEGEIMEYNEEPIEAVFHSASGGVTESAENIWSMSLPYLQSVASPMDEEAPVYYDKKVFTLATAAEILNTDAASLTFSVAARSEAGYVTKLAAGGKEYSGNEIRALFGLRSSNFSVTNTAEEIIFETHGYGHGVGMSQYGANFMALDGDTYDQILTHYYQGAELKKIY